MRKFSAFVYCFALLGAFSAAASAAECPGNPGALGTSRVMTIDPADYPRIGAMQYRDGLPLEDKEVVLTFDDGPLPPYTIRILETLAAECVKANYFIVGSMARAYPNLVRRIHAEGHVIGTHTETHPRAFDKLPPATAHNEIETGFASTEAALRVQNGVAPFFRIPGLRRGENAEAYLRARGTSLWSADLTGDDWRHISASEVVKRVMHRLNERGKGIILLHDIQPATALALPELLRQLKAGGYRIVLVAPSSREQPAVATAPKTPAAAASAQPAAVAAPPSLATGVAVLPKSPQPLPASAAAVARPRAAASAGAPSVVPPQSIENVVVARPVAPEITRPLTPALKPSHSVGVYQKM